MEGLLALASLDASALHPSSPLSSASSTPLISERRSLLEREKALEETLGPRFGVKPVSPFHNFDFRPDPSSTYGPRRNTSPQLSPTSNEHSIFQRAPEQPAADPRLLRTMSGQSLTPDGHLHAARRLATARSERSATSRRNINSTRYIPSVLLDLPHVTDFTDPGTNMRLMDQLYNATFYDFVRGEENIMTIARHLLPIAKEYNLRLIASGLRWAMNGWKLESVAKLLKILTRDWLPDVCGTFINLISIGWKVEEILDVETQSKIAIIRFVDSMNALTSKLLTSTAETNLSRLHINSVLKLVAIMVAGESAETAAIFVKALTCTENWSSERVTELVSFLDTVLDWDETYFRLFTEKYVSLSREDEQPGDESVNSDNEDIEVGQVTLGFRSAKRRTKRPGSSKLAFDYLAALYKTNLALANYKLALADFKLALAARNLNGNEGEGEESRRNSLDGSTSDQGSSNLGDFRRHSVTPLDVFRNLLQQRHSQPELLRGSVSSMGSSTTPVDSAVQLSQAEEEPAVLHQGNGFLQINWLTDIQEDDYAHDADLRGSSQDFWGDVMETPVDSERDETHHE